MKSYELGKLANEILSQLCGKTISGSSGRESSVS